MYGEIDYSGILKVPSVSELKKFRIDIDGIYGWGVCYYNPQVQKMFKEMIEKLSNELSEVISASVKFTEADGHGGCATIKGIDNNSYVYLHPMEFTGYLKDSDIENLYKFVMMYFRFEREKDSDLGEHPDFGARITFREEVFTMSDEEYLKLIEDYSDEILARTKSAFDKLSPKAKDSFIKYGASQCGQDFCHTGRIVRDTDKAGYSSLDVDWKAVTDIVQKAIDNGYFDI